MNKKVVIVDYGLGNIRSAQKSIEKAIELKKDKSTTVERSSRYESLHEATHIVLPGQGAFEACINGLASLDGMLEELNNQILFKKKPIFGICVGMQLFADVSFENGEHKGLGWIGGKVLKIESREKVLPHMGWNKIKKTTSHPILLGLEDEHFYFVHSYCFKLKNSNEALAVSEYETEFTAAVAKDNIFGSQFHPEKSANAGIKVLSNFLSL